MSDKDKIKFIYDTESVCEKNDYLYQYGAMRIDLCGLPPEDYEKTIFNTK